jgi:phenylacetaldehyde dehydrogenase
MVALSSKTAEFIRQPKQLLINGRWEHAVSGKTFPVTNPATAEIIAYAAEGEKEDIDKAVIAARRALENKAWANMTPSERGKLVWRIGDLILKYADELAEIESLDNGKPVSVARVADVALAADIFHYMAGWATKLHGLTIPLSVPNARFLSYTNREPVGVVGQIIPWNFPLLMAAWKLAPALTTGCTVVLKVA